MARRRIPVAAGGQHSVPPKHSRSPQNYRFHQVRRSAKAKAAEQMPVDKGGRGSSSRGDNDSFIKSIAKVRVVCAAFKEDGRWETGSG